MPNHDRNNYRGGFLWRCTYCGGWFSLWRDPTLWAHLASVHNYHAWDDGGSDRRHAIPNGHRGRTPQTVIEMELGPYRWRHEQEVAD